MESFLVANYRPLVQTADSGHAVAAPSDAEQIHALAGDPDFMTSLARGLAVGRAFDRAFALLLG